MNPPGFSSASAPTRFVFPPPAELLEPGVYEYGFQDFATAYQDPGNPYQNFNAAAAAAGQPFVNNGFQEEQYPFGAYQEEVNTTAGYQAASGEFGEDPGTGYDGYQNQVHQSNDGLDDDGFDNPDVMSGEYSMAAYAEASADFAAMATLPDGFEDDDDVETVQQGNNSIFSLSLHFKLKSPFQLYPFHLKLRAADSDSIRLLSQDDMLSTVER